MEERRSFLNRQNDRLKFCLKMKEFFQKVQRDLEKEVRARLAVKLADGTLDRSNEDTPTNVRVEVRKSSKNIYIEGIHEGDGAPTKVVHVSLHLKEGDLQDRIGAIHGRSNLNDTQFVRYFFELVGDVPRLRTTTENEGWTMAQLNARNYNTLPAGDQRVFVELVFEILNEYLPSYVLSEAECEAKTKAVDEVEQEEAQEQEEKEEEGAKKYEEGSKGSGAGAAAASSSSSSAAASARPVCPKHLNQEETALVNAVNDVITFYALGQSNGYEPPWIRFEPAFFLGVDYVDEYSPTHLAFLNKYISNNADMLKKIYGYDKLFTLENPGESLEEKKIRLERVDRIQFGKKMLEDMNAYYEQMILYLTAVNQAIGALYTRSNELEFEYLLPCLKTEELELITDSDTRFTLEDMTNYIASMNTQEKKNAVVKAIPYWNRAHLMSKIRVAQLAIDLDTILMDRLTTAILNRSRHIAASEQMINRMFGEIAQTEEKIAELKQVKNVAAKEMEGLQAQKANKKGKEKVSLLQRIKELQDGLNAVDAEILLRNTMRGSLFPTFQAARETVQKEKQELKEKAEARNNLKQLLKENTNLLLALWRLKESKFPRENVPGGLYPKPFSGGKSIRIRKTRSLKKKQKKTRKRFT